MTRRQRRWLQKFVPEVQNARAAEVHRSAGIRQVNIHPAFSVLRGTECYA